MSLLPALCLPFADSLASIEQFVVTGMAWLTLFAAPSTSSSWRVARCWLDRKRNQPRTSAVRSWKVGSMVTLSYLEQRINSQSNIPYCRLSGHRDSEDHVEDDCNSAHAASTSSRLGAAAWRPAKAGTAARSASPPTPCAWPARSRASPWTCAWPSV